MHHMLSLPDTLEHDLNGNQNLLLHTLEVSVPLEMFQKLQVLQDLLQAKSIDIVVIAMLETYINQAIIMAQQTNNSDAAEMSDQVAITDVLITYKNLETEVETTAVNLFKIYQLVEETNQLIKVLTNGIIS